MTFTHTWRDSLALFLPKNGKLFFLVTLKTIIRTYVLLFTRLCWLILASIPFFFGAAYLFSLPAINDQLISFLYVLVVEGILFFLVILAIRPSVLKKDTHYFLLYMRYFLLYTVFRLCMEVLLTIVLLIKTPFLRSFMLLDTPIVISPFIIFFTLFFLDSKGTFLDMIRSAKRSVVMVWYNYPFCLLNFLFFCYIYNVFVLAALSYCSKMFSIFISSFSLGLIILFVTQYLYLWIFMPILLAVFINFYVKVIYQQLNLYVPVIKKG